jgi:hypothetical protein
MVRRDEWCPYRPHLLRDWAHPAYIGCAVQRGVYVRACMGASPVPVLMWEGRAQSRCRCGRGEPSPGADEGGVSPVPALMWEG